MMKCEFRSKPEKYGLYQGEFFCKTHMGYTIKQDCPRKDEHNDPKTLMGLARIIDPSAFPTDEQIKIHSVCYTGWEPYQMEERCRMDYESKQRFAIVAAQRVLEAL